MKIRLEDIPDEGLEAHLSDGNAAPDELGPQVERVIEPLTAELHLLRQEDGLVLARGRIAGRFGLACSRCLAPVEFALDEPVELVFRPQPQGLGRQEIPLDGSDLDEVFYQGEELDLTESLRSEAGLALPMAPLCGEACQGLCPKCGRPKAEGCQCREDDIDPRLAKLAELKLN